MTRDLRGIEDGQEKNPETEKESLRERGQIHCSSTYMDYVCAVAVQTTNRCTYVLKMADQQMHTSEEKKAHYVRIRTD